MRLYPLCYANDNDALIPELWANESLAILEENMVMANLVHRDFSPMVQSFGDVVNTRRPQEFKSKRKTQSDNVVSQDAVSVNVQVPLDQHVYQTFTIYDEEASLSFKELVSYYLEPAAMQMARTVDRVLTGQAFRFFNNAAGKLGGMNGANAKDYMLDAMQIMDVNKAYPNGRRMVLTPQANTAALKSEIFTKANERGDGGTALENASLGRVLAFDTYMDQNTPYRALSDGDVITLNHVAGAVAGDTGNKAVTSATEVTDGSFVWFEGDQQPQVIQAHTGAGSTTGVTLVSPYKHDVSANAVGYAWAPVQANGAYAAGYQKEVSVDGFTSGKPPAVGQFIATGTGTSRKMYSIIELTTVSATEVEVLLDRPLEVAIANDEDMYPGPQGSFNLCFHRDALALVSRPLAAPPTRNVEAAVGSYNNLAMRIAMQYDIKAQGTIVTVDMLCGTALLDEDLGVVLYA